MLATPEIICEAAQLSRLQALLPRWREAPLYHNRLPSRVNGARLSRLPFTTKHEIRLDFPRNFLRPGQRLETLLAEKRVEVEHTSGTSEERLPVLFGLDWWDGQEERALRLNSLVAGVLDRHPQARRATLTTPACNGRVCFSAFRSRSYRTAGATLFVNLARIPFVLADSEMKRMADEIGEWAPQFLDVDPVHGAWFALHCERQGIRFPALKFVLCSYEFVSVVHRRILQRVFGAPVFNLYGSTETGHLVMEDERGDMKPVCENAYLEVVEPDERGIGDLVATTLTNDYMPLLRYRIGDLVERHEQPYGTACLVHGRSRDVLSGRDGRRITTLQADQCFAGADGIAHYQLRQDKNKGLRLRLVFDGNGPAPEGLKEVVSRLETLLEPPGKIAVEPVKLLPPTPSGKFRLTCRSP
ncbi:MAG: hypothetical protein KGR98_02275 [Verrucomicrobia bacterium]|nr:hypothetical protein [Verrucomicrobiota bacterium]MDE3099559.1 hypothetical protein [Verrucomicrobiota bacterium]